MKRKHHFYAPLLKLSVCLMGGIVVAHYATLPLPVVPFLVATLVAAWMLRRTPVVQSLVICAAFFEMGLLAESSQRHYPEGLGDAPSAEGIQGGLEAVVMSEPTEKPKTLMMDLTLPRLGETRRCYIWKDSLSRQLTLGDALTVRLNDGHFVRWDGWQPGGNGLQQLSPLQRVRLRALLLRHRLLSRYRLLNVGDEQYAVLAAMTLGDKSALTNELRQTYSVAGASHILALSGLHLGIIYFLLMSITGRRRRSWLVQLLLVLCIWAFAFVTGLSPGVVRSATMLTVYAIFSIGGRDRMSVNALCLTAIVMLLINARSLFDVSFQLSFASVFAILLFLPLFEGIQGPDFRFRHPFLNKLWSLATVSLAAQMGVAPLTAYYFGSFPTYFLLTNFVVIPAATVILYGTLCALIFPPLGTLLGWVVKLLNAFLDIVAQLPLASITNLHPTVVQVCLYYAVIGCLYGILHKLYARPSL
ncbi:MAG: ComEC/Rec2 family competence protein [Prevotella sp.]|nr:ComEC/Rec2 family competence protein [Prevotella sp.]